MPPFEPDVESNIPKDIRSLCDVTEVTIVFPPIEKGRDYVVDKRMILGVRFNFLTEPGYELWTKIERYLDKMIPRDQKVPDPVIVAPNQKDSFNPHQTRRTARGSLEMFPSEIPVVDLRTISLTQEPVYTVATSSQVILPVPSVETKTVGPDFSSVKIEKKIITDVECDVCQKKFSNVRAVRMHKMKSHSKKKEPAGV